MYNTSQVHLSGNIIKILWRQQQELLKKSPEYVTPIINNEDPLDIQIDLEGPKATPYEGGIFRVKLIIPNDFPVVAPKGLFITKIFHPNISEKGDICVNTLKKDWNSHQWSLYNLFEVIKCLLIIPFPQSALNEEAGKLFMENYEEYFKIAKMYTKIYAMKNKNNIINDNNSSNNSNDVMMIKDKKERKPNNNEEDIEMEDSSIKNNMDTNNNNLNKRKFTKDEFRINNNIFESIGNLEHKRMTEMLRSNYNLNCNYYNETKSNLYYQTNKKDFYTNNNELKMNNNYVNNMMNSNMNFFNNINNNSNNFNEYFGNKQFLSSKEKPNLSYLPLMNTNQIKNTNKLFGYHRSLTFNNISQNSTINNNYNNSQEINKWLMRI